MGLRAEGIDVSHYHPVRDWELMLNAGMAFFGAKATQGHGFTDPTFAAHRDGCRRYPFVMVAYYHFARPGDPIKQVGRLLDAVGELRDNERLALDVEGNDAPGVTWVDAFIRELVRRVPDRRPLVYTSARIWRDVLKLPDWPGAIATDLWAPRYGLEEPELPADAEGFPIWPRWTFWQDSQSFPCPGVDGACDHSVFRGGLEDLKAYAG
jgi:lysozyme